MVDLEILRAGIVARNLMSVLVFQLLQAFLSRFLQPVLKPVTRLFLGFIAVPIFRFTMRKVVRVQEIDEELEKDLEQWFRGSLLLLAATDNMEHTLFFWLPAATVATWYFQAGRILLAIGVIEVMPDQSLFALIHPGPQKPKIEKGRVIRSLLAYIPQLGKGLVCQHLNRSSPVFAILSVLHGGEVGWICYGIAITQYLIIGLVTSKDRALDVLSQFDQAVARHRSEIESEMGQKITLQANQRVDDPAGSVAVSTEPPALTSCVKDDALLVDLGKQP